MDKRDCQGLTPLLLALQKNQTAIAQQFLAMGASVNAIDDSNGFTCLHYAVYHGNVEIVYHLLLLPDTRRQIIKECKQGKIPLMLAAAKGDAVMVNVLLMHDARTIDYYSSLTGRTAFHEAVLGGNLSVCQLLLGRKDGCSPLLYDIEECIRV